MRIAKISSKRRMRTIMWISMLILFLLLIRIAVIQFKDGMKLKNLAYEQQTLNRNISPKRGTIYDATGKIY